MSYNFVDQLVAALEFFFIGCSLIRIHFIRHLCPCSWFATLESHLSCVEPNYNVFNVFYITCIFGIEPNKK